MKLALENIHNGTPTHWFALVSDYHNMHAKVYQKISGHLVEPLYLSTPIESLQNRSPLLISLYPQDPIVELLPKKNTLYFATSLDISLPEVLAHLRNRLQIQFSGNKKGVFHYYLPSVASYFFTFSDKVDSANWLGIFTNLYLYQQIKSKPSEWIKVEGTGKPQKLPLWGMTASQEFALNEKFHEQGILQWAEIENIASFDWQKQKQVESFCVQHQINQPQLTTQVRHLVQLYAISLNTLNFVPSQPKTPESTVEELEILMSREYKNV